MSVVPGTTPKRWEYFAIGGTLHGTLLDAGVKGCAPYEGMRISAIINRHVMEEYFLRTVWFEVPTRKAQYLVHASLRPADAFHAILLFEEGEPDSIGIVNG